MSRASELADWCDEHSSGDYRTSAEAATELRRLDRVNAELWNIKPQIAKPENGPEPSLRTIIKSYYRVHGCPEPVACEYADEYIAALTSATKETK